MLNPLSNAFGLDIGDRSFKLAQLRRARGKNNPYRLAAWSSVDVPEGIMEKGQVTDYERASSLIMKLMKDVSGRLKGRAVVACLPEARTFIKIIDGKEGQSESQLKKAIKREIELNIPLPPDEIYYDWQLITPLGTEEEEGNKTKKGKKSKKEKKKEAGKDEKKEEDNPEEKGEDKPESGEEKDGPGEEKKPEESTEPVIKEGEGIKILLGAAPKKLVDDYTTILDMAGLAPIALEIEATAISRCIAPAFENLPEAIGILDIGATRSSLVVYDRGMIQMSISIPISGIQITETIAKALSIGMDEAEILKQECGLDANRCEDRIWKIIAPLIDDMTQKIRNALRFYKIGFPYGKKVEHIYLCGGGAHFREVDTVLSNQLAIKVERGDALTNVRRPIPRKFPHDSALSFATAIGLGIRAASEAGRRMSNFR
ncbi:MAG: pilus assembly protein PilM [Patescibacteria group bacterium]|nr:pilus assembly protein PilM [Patescibacteria group bacterium]